MSRNIVALASITSFLKFILRTYDLYLDIGLDIVKQLSTCHLAKPSALSGSLDLDPTNT